MVASVYCSISSQDLQSDYLLLLEGCTDNLLLRDRRTAAQTNAFENLPLGGILRVRLLNLGLLRIRFPGCTREREKWRKGFSTPEPCPHKNGFYEGKVEGAHGGIVTLLSQTHHCDRQSHTVTSSEPKLHFKKKSACRNWDLPSAMFYNTHLLDKLIIKEVRQECTKT